MFNQALLQPPPSFVDKSPSLKETVNPSRIEVVCGTPRAILIGAAYVLACVVSGHTFFRCIFTENRADDG